MADNIGDQIKSGALWTYFQGGVGTVIQFGTGVVLARLLTPDQFGVFFAVSAYTAILLQQVQFGIPAALLQAKDLTEDQWNAAFWLMMALGAALALLIVIGAGWMGTFYGDARYAPLMRWMAVVFLITPYSSINSTMLRRDMNYKALAKVSVTIGMTGVVLSIGCALAGFGPFTFVISGIYSAIGSAVLMARIAPWRPALPRTFEGLRSLWNFGWRMHVNGTLNLTASRIDNMMIARLSGVYELGIYNRAFSLSRMPVTQVLSRLYALLFSGFSRVQDDVAHSKKLNQKIMCAMTSTIFPLLLILIFTADGFIRLVYGVTWVPAATPLSIMAIGSFALVISSTMGALSDAQGLVGREIPIQLANVVMTVAAVVWGAKWGLSGIAIGIAAKSFVMLLLLQRMLSRSHLALKWTGIIEAVLPAIVASSVAIAAALIAHAMLVHFTSVTEAPYVFAIGFIISAAYLITWLLQSKLWISNEPLQSSAELLRVIVGGGRRVAQRR